MRLKWYGHASFLVTSDEGLKIITDPYTPEAAGYPPITDRADVVIISSDNDRYHCRADLIPGAPEVVNALTVAQSGGQQTVKGVVIQAIQAMEALDHRYHDPDQNGMYRFVVDGISIGHMGDIGNALTDEQIAFFDEVDILLALAGGHPTLALDDLKTLIDRARPRWVVPMHFQTLTYKQNDILWLGDFLCYFEKADIDFAAHYEKEIHPADLPQATRVLVMDYARGS